MKIKNKKLFFFILSLLIIVIIFVFIAISKRKNNLSTAPLYLPEDRLTNNSKIRDDSIMIDFDGDGVKEVLNVDEKETGIVNMNLFDLEGNKIAELADDLYLLNTTFFKIVKLNEKSPKEYLQWNMASGPHQIETVFLTIDGDKIEPVLSVDFEKDSAYSPFYNSRGDLLVGDVDLDGSIEVIECVDEYPVNAPRLNDPEIDKIVREEFGDLGDESVADSMIEIFKRENNGKGRGRKVILAIHRFVDAELPFFRRLPSAEYEVIAGKLISAIEGILKESENMKKPEGFETESIMRYSDLEQDSKDFNEFVRKFWTHGEPYEFSINDDSAE